jgi:predicted pyridoxine 5'-phosphate oxidase superfamily flavin-nucleotide-binding protein
MATLPDEVRQAWEDRDRRPAILATVAPDGTPNIIYVSCWSLCGGDRVVIADNFFSKTRANIMAGSKGALLFRRTDGTPYQIKGSFEYHTEGDVYEDMKRWNPSDKPGHAAAAIVVEEVYTRAERLL